MDAEPQLCRDMDPGRAWLVDHRFVADAAGDETELAQRALAEAVDGGHGRLVQLHQRGSQARTHAGTVVDGGDRLRDDRRGLALLVAEIGRASCRERVCQYV